MKFIIGKKQEMTHVWKNDEMVAVTRVSAGPCVVTQVRTQEKDGYSAVQVGYGEKKEKNCKKPQKGHAKNLGNIRYFKEFRVKTGELEPGCQFNVSSFQAGDTVKVTGTSKGKGFQGVVKKYGFKGAITTHGTKDQVRMPGSIGATGPAHVFKGIRMAGRTGGEKVSVKNLEVVEVDVENNFLYIKGAVPGARNGLVFLEGEGDIKVVAQEKQEKKEKKTEEKEVVNKDKEEVIKEIEKKEIKEEVKNEDKKEEEQEKIKDDK